MTSPTDLGNCDREPIHLPGSIQPHGCLLVCDPEAHRVGSYSANASELLGTAGDPIGLTLPEVVGPEAAHALLNALARSAETNRPGLFLGLEVGARRFDAAIHGHGGRILVEFEPAAGGDDPLDVARALISRTRTLQSVEAMARLVPRYLQAILGYDRVMVYRFAEDGSGKVIGEAKRSHLESFLGQHFPAADIPRQARVLYLRNTIRVIADAAGPRSPILSGPADRDPVDLSFAHLRSVSPVHLEYLRNMGVGASMSVSIVVGDRLWGLVACHHYAPRRLTMAQRVAAELFGDFVSLHLAAILHQRRFDASAEARSLLDDLTSDMVFRETPGEFLAKRLGDMAALVECDGVGLWIEGVWSKEGVTVPAGFVPALVRHLAARGDIEIWATDALSDRIPSAEAFAADVSGVLAVPLSHQARDYLFFFRRELKQTVEWAGDPNKSYEVGPLGDRLTPRKSFAIWKELVDRQAAPWTDFDLDTAAAAQIRLRDVIMRQSEVLAAERQKAEVRQRVLNEELNHRVKNILSLIKSLVNRPVDASLALEDYAAGLRGRIVALANAHDQVIRSDGGGALRQLVEAELSPYARHQLQVEGPSVGLDARAYSVMALVFHELATNAAKYGALSVPDGTLTIRWSRDRDGCLIRWREANGPPVRAPARQGFGTVLLRRSVPFDLEGRSEVTYDAAGVAASFFIPSKFLTDHRAEGPAEPAPAPAGPDFSLAGRSVLLVEDQLVIALDAELMLSDLGAGSVTTAPSVAEALRAIAAAPPDLAILDVNLGSTTSLPVADELKARGVPFIFATGYGDSQMIDPGHRNTPVTRKPYSRETLAGALHELVARLAVTSVD